MTLGFFLPPVANSKSATRTFCSSSSSSLPLKPPKLVSDNQTSTKKQIFFHHHFLKMEFILQSIIIMTTDGNSPCTMDQSKATKDTKSVEKRRLWAGRESNHDNCKIGFELIYLSFCCTQVTKNTDIIVLIQQCLKTYRKSLIIYAGRF